MTYFAALLNEQPPLEHDVFGNLEHAMREHRAHFAGEPVVEFRATSGIR